MTMINTPITATSAAAQGMGQGAGQAAGLGLAAGAGVFGGNGHGISGGVSFMDMIFARSAVQDAAAALTTTPANAAPQMPAITVHAAITPHTETLSAEQIAALQAAAQKQQGQVTPESKLGNLIDMLQLIENGDLDGAQALLDETILTDDALVADITAQQITTNIVADPQFQQALKALHAAIKQTLQGQPQIETPAFDSAADPTQADPALIAASLSPAEMTKIAEELLAQAKALKEKSAPDAAPIAGDITGAESTKQAAAALTAMAQAIINTVNEAGGNASSDAAPARMNTPLPPSPENLALAEAMRAASQQNVSASNAAPVQNGADKNGAQAQPQGAQNAANNNAGGSSFNSAAAAADFDALLNSAGWDSIYPDGLEWTQNGAGPAQTLSLTGTASFTSLVAHAQNATTPHPATQAVAATLSKAAQDGESKTMTLRLDPPELGRIEIRMDFGKEKGMKAHIVMEKPETMLMMQRDAHILERALQDAGLDANGGLSFELAQDGNMFNDGHDAPNRHAGGSGGSADQTEDEIIETTMNWYVDAATGMTRYDILA